MIDQHPKDVAPISSSAGLRAGLRAFVARELPYLAILLLALFGIAYTSVARQPILPYWLALAPFIGIVCIVTRWHVVEGRGMRSLLIWTNVLHWAAVLAAMYLMSVADVGQMANADGRALASLIILALGTFTAGVHMAAWRICLVGIVLGASVPPLAWLGQSALLLVLAALVLIGITAPFWWRDSAAIKKSATPGGAAKSAP